MDQVQQDRYGNYVAWTGRNNCQEPSDSSPRKQEVEEIRNRYRPGMINETQDRASIASKSGFLNVNDITGITRGGEVTVTHENPYPYQPDNFRNSGPQADISCDMGSSSEEISYFHPEMLHKHKGQYPNQAPYFYHNQGQIQRN